jgi:hypothetical protein
VKGQKYTVAVLIVGPVIAMAILNWVPDYFSYMKTRLILKRISKVHGILGLLGFAFIDTFLTIILFLLTMGLLLFIAKGYVITLPDLERAFLLTISFHAANGELAGGIFFFSALFVSAWSWLYALTVLITRLVVQVFPSTLKSTAWFFDINGHPLRSLGCIAGGIVFACILTAQSLT